MRAGKSRFGGSLPSGAELVSVGVRFCWWAVDFVLGRRSKSMRVHFGASAAREAGFLGGKQFWIS